MVNTPAKYLAEKPPYFVKYYRTKPFKLIASTEFILVNFCSAGDEVLLVTAQGDKGSVERARF